MQSIVNHAKQLVLCKKSTPVSIRLIVMAENYSNAGKSRQKKKKKCKNNSHLLKPLNKIHSNTFLNNQELQSKLSRNVGKS